ncbi:MAG: hypothetical protein WB867_02090 [Candidatus Dormiibacterota bacterium]
MTNPALADLALLVGQWKMDLYGAAFLPDPDTHLAGSVVVDWIEDGAAMVIRQGDSEHPPAAVWIIGRDENDSNFEVLYSDDRGVSRLYDMSFAVPDWRMWRTTPELSQRFESVIASDGHTIKGAWKKSFDGGATWEHDFNLDYIRVPPSDRASKGC